jgi:cyclopropane fatty-acyl-phospholipid synthase-like methyltransferase
MAKRKKRKFTATTADKWDLYERSVQEPSADIDLIDQVWRELRGRQAHHLREDFCGTAVNSVAWVKHRRTNTAIGVDISPDVLALAERRITRRLKPPDRKRIRLLEADVLKVEAGPVDTVVATNFSYFTFKTRRLLKRYFRSVRDALVDDGMLLLDAYGGSDAFLEVEEPREQDGFTYVWDQYHYNPVTGDVINYIHFKFPDGTRIKRAFTYEWRLWTLPELRELLKEAGFKRVTVYWEGTDEETEEGNGVFTVTRTGEACEGWIAYLAAEK